MILYNDLYSSGHEALTLADELSHSFSFAFALNVAAGLHERRGELSAARERAEALMTFSRAHGFPHFLAAGAHLLGCVLVQQGQTEEGIVQMREGMAAMQAAGAQILRPGQLARLAWAYGTLGQTEEGLALLAEALADVHQQGQRRYEAELYRRKGELTLQQSRVQGREASGQKEAEACFLKAVEIARRQRAKSLELRATMSLSRLWQQQGKKKEAHEMLAEIYGWFTEGFDTKDLQEAQALLEELSH